jgi:hypothetical protein
MLLDTRTSKPLHNLEPGGSRDEDVEAKEEDSPGVTIMEVSVSRTLIHFSPGDRCKLGYSKL